MTDRSDLVQLMKALAYGAKNARSEIPIRTLKEPERKKKEDDTEELDGNKVIKVGLKKEKGWLYYLDVDGDIARTPMKKGGNKGKRKSNLMIKEKIIRQFVEKPVEVKALPAPADDTSQKNVTEINVRPETQNVTIKIEHKSSEQKKHGPDMVKMKERIGQLEKALSLISKKGNEEKHGMLKKKIDDMKKKIN